MPSKATRASLWAGRARLENDEYRRPAPVTPNVSKIRPCNAGGRCVARGGPAASASICLAGGSGGRRVGSRCGAACADSQRPTSPCVSSSPLGARAVRCAGVRDRGCARASTPAATSRWRSADDTGGRPSARLLHVAKNVFLIAAPFVKGGHATCSEALVGDDDLVLMLAAGGAEQIELHGFFVLLPLQAAHEDEARFAAPAFELPALFKRVAAIAAGDGVPPAPRRWSHAHCRCGAAQSRTCPVCATVQATVNGVCWNFHPWRPFV
jgi:hypothetical protein